MSQIYENPLLLLVPKNATRQEVMDCFSKVLIPKVLNESGPVPVFFGGLISLNSGLYGEPAMESLLTNYGHSGDYRTPPALETSLRLLEPLQNLGLIGQVHRNMDHIKGHLNGSGSGETSHDRLSEKQGWLLDLCIANGLDTVDHYDPPIPDLWAHFDYEREGLPPDKWYPRTVT
ncbi:MAG: hypothetical protein JW727_04180 [Candidatus Aenigmarchaeota archaeon]|nr:hypothetical protein [Candidatus Aenigmarchaeota archaeon]